MRLRFAIVGLSALALTGCGATTTKTVTVNAPSAPARTEVRIYRVPSLSMEQTLPIGAHVETRPLTGVPKVGQIVIFHPPEGAEQQECGPTPHVVKLGGAACDAPVPRESSVNFVKRIVGGPGDSLSITEGHVIRNGVQEPDSYARSCGASPECNFPTPIKIPTGHWFVMGDNRGASDDSRFWGPVPTEWIVAVAGQCLSHCGTR